MINTYVTIYTDGACSGNPGEVQVNPAQTLPRHERGTNMAPLIVKYDARRRQEYNQVRPHSALGYRPPAPETRMPVSLTL